MVKTAPARRTPHAALSARHVVVRFGRRTVLRGCTLEVEAGAMVALLGRNGAGKSTLLRCLSGVLAPQEGEVLLGGRSLREVGRREIARTMAVVPQEVTVPFSFSVREMVALGRTPYVRPQRHHLPHTEGEGNRHLL